MDEYGCKYAGDVLLKCVESAPVVYVKEGTRIIAGNAFQYNKIIEKVILPNSLYYIGEGAFQSCKHLEEVMFDQDSNLKMIDNDAFMFCIQLKGLVLPEKLNKIGRCAFSDCGMEWIRIPKNVEHIEPGICGILDFCVNLKEIELPEHLKDTYEAQKIVSPYYLGGVKSPKITFYP